MALIDINKNPTRKELLVFVGLLAIFLAIVGHVVQRGGSAGAARALFVASVASLAVLGPLAWLAPRVVRGVYLTWMYLALPIGTTVSLLLLGLIWYSIITPIGWALRLTGRDAPGLRFDREAPSYWTERTKRRGLESYFRQF